MDRFFVIAGSIVMFTAVGAGAFGAHGLSNYFVSHPELEATFDTAVRYQMIHGLSLFIVAWITVRYGPSYSSWAGYMFILGIILFSGSLYLLVLTRTSWLGAVTPFGGVAFLAGWTLLAVAAWRVQS